jgi:hypothetical protein
LPTSRTSSISSSKPFYLVFPIANFNCSIFLLLSGTKYNQQLLVALFIIIIIIISSHGTK